MVDVWPTTCDELGPRAVVLIREPEADLEAYVVVDNVAAGPAIGGVRMASEVTVEEVARLARAMTYKNIAAGIPHGGAKAGIVGAPNMAAEHKERTLRAFARSIRVLHNYIPGPDMGTDERCMAWVHDEIGRAVGLPRVLGGIPLDEIGATGFGLAVCAEAVAAAGGPPLQPARIAVQGFGAVGRHAARFLTQRGAVIVAVSDSRGATRCTDGLDVDALLRWKATGATVAEFPGGHSFPASALLTMDCDVLVPAARPDALTVSNAPSVQAAVVLPGANIPATPEAEEILYARGVLCIPDFVANAGGVICAAVEHGGGREADAFAAIEERIRSNTSQVLARAHGQCETPRAAAQTIVRERLREAMGYRQDAGS